MTERSMRLENILKKGLVKSGSLGVLLGWLVGIFLRKGFKLVLDFLFNPDCIELTAFPLPQHTECYGYKSVPLFPAMESFF